jgi:hypothetical protein
LTEFSNSIFINDIFKRKVSTKNSSRNLILSGKAKLQFTQRGFYLVVNIWMLNWSSSCRWLWSECRCLWSIDIIVPIVRHERSVGYIVHEPIVVGHIGMAVIVGVCQAWGVGKNLEENVNKRMRTETVQRQIQIKTTK